jgi:hypothetical protein
MARCRTIIAALSLLFAAAAKAGFLLNATSVPVLVAGTGWSGPTARRLKQRFAVWPTDPDAPLVANPAQAANPKNLSVG